MTLRLNLFALLLIATLALAACGQPADSAQPAAPTADAMMEATDSAMEKPADGAMASAEMAAEDDAMMKDEGGDEAMMDDASHDDAMAGDEMAGDGDAMMDEAAVDLPAWSNVELTDVNSGEGFRIADHQGQVVLVETLAVWCSNCLKQQKQVKALHEILGERDDFVSVGLDIDLNEDAGKLRGHAERNEFDWVYAVATPEVAREIGQLYGNLFLNPPSTPMLIVDRSGQVHPLPFGIKSAADLQEALAPFLAEMM